MTITTAFSAGAAIMMLMIAFVAGGLLVAAAVTIPAAAVYAVILWAAETWKAMQQKESRRVPFGRGGGRLTRSQGR